MLTYEMSQTLATNHMRHILLFILQGKVSVCYETSDVVHI